MQFANRKSISLVTAVGCLLVLSSWLAQTMGAKESAADPPTTPADGYTVHVTAPHTVNGHEMGPYHHYCKVIAPDPQIVCQIYDTTAPTLLLRRSNSSWPKN